MGGADATWNRGPSGDMDVYALALTHRGASVLSMLKMAGVICGSSASIEGLALLKLSDWTVYARVVTARYGFAQEGPTVLLSDSESGLKAASGETSVSKMKHELRRSAIVTARVRDGEVVLAHVPDVANFVDFWTKWVSEQKVEQSLAYLTGERSRLAHATGTAEAAAAACVRAGVMAIAEAWEGAVLDAEHDVACRVPAAE